LFNDGCRYTELSLVSDALTVSYAILHPNEREAKYSELRRGQMFAVNFISTSYATSSAVTVSLKKALITCFNTIG
jgi:hypothetical protein